MQVSMEMNWEKRESTLAISQVKIEFLYSAVLYSSY